MRRCQGPVVAKKATPRDAFEAIKRGQREVDGHVQPTFDEAGDIVLYQPRCPVDKALDNKRQLIVNVFALFDKEGLGWLSPDVAMSLGQPLLVALGEVLWEVTDQWDVLAERSCRPAAIWEPFEGQRRLTHKATRIMHLSILEAKLVRLETEVQQTWWDAAISWCAAWTRMVAAVNELRRAINVFLQRREAQRGGIYSHRNNPAPLVVRGTSYEIFPIVRARVPSDPELSAALSLLASRLEQMKPYEPLSLSHNGHVPSQKADRAKWTQALKSTPMCSTPFALFYFHQGGALPMLYWAWRCDVVVRHGFNGDLSPEQQQTKTQNETTIAQLVADMPRIATRKELKDLRETVERVAAVPHCKRRLKDTLMMVAGGTNTKLGITPQLATRLEYMLSYVTEVELIKEWKRGGARIDSTSFAEFWDMVQAEVDKYGNAVHSRRAEGPDHVVAVANCPPPSSLADLHSRVCEQAAAKDTNIATPSLSWFKMQFAPKNPDCTAALQRTGKFQVRWTMQGHHLRADHEDRHYGAKYYKYLREMAISLRDVVLFVCQDDKKKIAVGEPGLPLAGGSYEFALC